MKRGLILLASLFLLSSSPWSAGTLKVTTPNGGQKWTTGKSYAVKWSKGSAGKYVRIRLLKSGKHYRWITKKTPNDGRYVWKIPTTVATGSNYKIRLQPFSKTGYDNSDRSFSISSDSDKSVFMKGVTFGANFWPEENLKWVDYNLDRLKTIGVDSIILAPDWYLDDYTDPTIEPWYRHKKGFPDTSWFSPTLYDREVKQIIRKAQARGFRVLLKPHVDTLDSPFGGIGRWGLRPAGNDWDTLFATYLRFIKHYARIAESLNVDVFIIGTELDSMTYWGVADSGLNNPEERWRSMIKKIRRIYRGKLTYSSSDHGNRSRTKGTCSPCKIKFWDALDYIGFEMYRGLTNRNRNPSLKQLMAGVRDTFDNYIEPLAQQYQKQVIIPEIAFYSFDGVNTNPLGHTWQSPYLVSNSRVDHMEQAVCYRAVLKVVDDIRSEKTYLEGLFWWDGRLIDPTADYSWVKQDKYGFPWFKPAETILRSFWGE